jgi:hypothetical protein
MDPILVPRPKQSARNPDRPVNALLEAQIQHLQHAERRLPLRYRSEIYIHTIRTEGEAAEYIREVTEAIHRAHEDAAVKRAKRAAKRRPGIKIAAPAERPPRKPSRKATAKSTGHRVAAKSARRKGGRR